MSKQTGCLTGAANGSPSIPQTPPLRRSTARRRWTPGLHKGELFGCPPRKPEPSHVQRAAGANNPPADRCIATRPTVKTQPCEPPIDLSRPKAGDSGPNPKTRDTHNSLTETGEAWGPTSPRAPRSAVLRHPKRGSFCVASTPILGKRATQAEHPGWSHRRRVRGELKRAPAGGYPNDHSPSPLN